MTKYKIKGITSEKKPVLQSTTSRMATYLKKGSKMRKANIVKKVDDCGCGGGKMQLGGKVGSYLGPAMQVAGTALSLIQNKKNRKAAEKRRPTQVPTAPQMRGPALAPSHLAPPTTIAQKRPVFTPSQLSPMKVNPKIGRNPMTPATDPRNSHNPNDPWANTNLSVGGGKPPVKLNLDGRAFSGYKQGNTLNGVPTLNYEGEGVSRYSGNNRNALAKYLGRSNPGVKTVIINGRRVAIRQ